MAGHEIRVRGKGCIAKTSQTADEWIATGTLRGIRIEVRGQNEPAVLEEWRLKALDSLVDTEWISAGKMVEYYLDYAEPPLANPRKALYEAVIAGEIRARYNGKVYGPEWLKQIDKL